MQKIGEFMEEEKVASLEELIELLKVPIEIKSETLGTLSFRRIYNDDYIFIEKCLNEDINQEIFCKQFLINQICNPILTLDDFNEVDDKEICSILKEYIELENLEDYFDFNSSDDIFTIFKEGMECYRNHVNSVVRSNQLALLESANSIINSFNFHESLSSYLNMVNEITAFKNLSTNIILMCVFMLGVVLGIVFVSKIIDWCLKHYKKETYYAIIGFVLSSIVSVLYEVSKFPMNEVHLVIGVVLLIINSVLVYKVFDL